jgi:hypothetical protein
MRFAARGLGLRYELAAYDVLERALVHPDQHIRLNAALPIFSGPFQAPSEFIALCLNDEHSDNDSLALLAASRSGSPRSIDRFAEIARDPARGRVDREIALLSLVRSGARPKDVAALCETMLLEPTGTAGEAPPAPAAIFQALAELPTGSACGARSLAEAAQRGLFDPALSIAAARALIALGERRVPDGLGSARERAVEDDRLRLSLALVILGDPSGVDDVVYRLRRRQGVAIRTLAALGESELPEEVTEALAEVATAADAEIAYCALRALSAPAPGRAESIARQRLAAAATGAEALDAALALARLGLADAPATLAAALRADGPSGTRFLDFAAIRLETSPTEILARLDDWTPGAESGGGLASLVAWRDEDAMADCPVASDERAANERRARRAEALLRSIEATRARFLDDVCGGLAGPSIGARFRVLAALAAIDDADAARLLAAVRERGDDRLREFLETVDSRTEPRLPTLTHAARAALRDWISSTPTSN